MDKVYSVWPEWHLEDTPLGKGSYGAVYKAVRNDHNVESYAAIKIISIPSDPSEINSLRSEGLDLAASKTYFQNIVDNFVGEIQLMEQIKGVQNIVSVEDYKVVERTGEIGWDIFIRMELLTPFTSYLQKNTLTETDVIKLGCDICTALEICGQRNIIHRDIKPENIFVNDFGHFKLGDFGIARRLENKTGGLSQKGTYNYMAPEVVNGREYDSRVDIYSLGIVLYRLLNGNRLPFLENDQQLLSPIDRKNAVERRIRGEHLPAPKNASPAMAKLILRACAYDPDMRFANATEMKQELIAVANNLCSDLTDPVLDSTISVRRAAFEYDRTTSVRKAPGSEGSHVDQFGTSMDFEPRRATVDYFDTEPEAKKKKTLLVMIIGLCFVLLLLISAIIALTVSLSRDDEDDKPEETVAVQKQSEQTVANTALLRENNTQYRINMFLSNFAETQFFSYPCDDYELLRFTREHCYYNNDGDISTSNGRDYIDETTVNDILYKYFAMGISESESSNHYINATGSASILYSSGRYSYPSTAYLYNGYVTVVSSMYMDSYGHYHVGFDVYHVDENYISEYEELYYLTSQEAQGNSHMTYSYSGQAVVQDYTRTNGKASFQLLELTCAN